MRSCLILICILFPSLAIAQEKVVKVEPIPSWVAVNEIHLDCIPSRTDSQSGYINYLIDEQYDVASQTSFHHYAYQILNTASLQDESNLTVTYVPSYQNLIFHYVWLRRAGLRINLLEKSRFNIVQREKSLEYNLYDGRLTAVLLLEDVRVGDILEYAYSYIGQNPIFGKKFLGSFQLKWSSPVKKSYFRLRMPREREINIKYFHTSIKMAKYQNHENTDYILEQENIPALDVEPDLPSWYFPYPWIQISEFQSWQEVAAWAYSLFKIPMKQDENLLSIINDLKKSKQSPEKYVEAALRFVQDDIRYFGVEIGINSHKPTNPGRVLHQRFGDCKDKSLLICTILSGAGIKAEPVLLNTELRGEIDSLLPSPLDFDHVVTHINVPSGEYFLDPTISYQRGILSLIAFPWTGKALIVDSSSTELIDLKSNCEETGRNEIYEFYKIDNFKQPVELSVTNKFYGYDADLARAYYSLFTAKQLKDAGYNYYIKEYNNLTITKPFSITEDDEIKNILTIEEAYSIDSFWQQSQIVNRLEGSFYATLLRNKFQQSARIQRTMPFRINHPSHLTYRITATLPETWNIKNSNDTITDPAFRFSYSMAFGNKYLNIEYNYKSKKGWVPQDQFPTYVKNVNEALGQIGYTLYYYPGGSGRMAWIFYAIIGFSLIIGTLLIVKVARQRAKEVDELIVAPDSLPQSEENVELSVEYQCSKCGSNVFKSDQICPHCNTSLETNLKIIETSVPQVENESQSIVQTELSSPEPKSYKGIRGWLIIPAIALIASLLRVPWEVASTLIPPFKQSVWDSVTTPGLQTYHPMFAPVLIMELVINIAIIILSIITAIYFFRKMHQTRLFIIILLIASPSVLFFDSLMVNLAGLTAYNTNIFHTDEILRTSLFSLIWIFYFIRSRRVRVTFIR
jgi:transglutaminase-like putative cysteine protease